MLKKVGIVAAVIAIVGFFAYTTLASGATTEAVKKEWTLTDKNIEGIDFLGVDQDIQVDIEETNEEKTTVTVEGKVSERAKKNLEDSVSTGQQLKVVLGETEGFKIAATNNGKDTLKVKIRLAEGAAFKKVSIDMGIGNTIITVPESYDGKYELTPASAGKVLEVPDTKETMKSTIKVDGIGDITVKK